VEPNLCFRLLSVNSQICSAKMKDDWCVAFTRAKEKEGPMSKFYFPMVTTRK
jgi:hypothetical protein